jgi:hypothetical protein
VENKEGSGNGGCNNYMNWSLLPNPKKATTMPPFSIMTGHNNKKKSHENTNQKN